MNRRLFIKTLSLLIGSLTLRLSSEQVKELVSFNYGVASGDPTDSHVVLWTKLTKQKKTKVKVLWEVSLDKNFESTINSGTFLANPEDDFDEVIRKQRADDALPICDLKLLTVH